MWKQKCKAESDGRGLHQVVHGALKNWNRCFLCQMGLDTRPWWLFYKQGGWLIGGGVCHSVTSPWNDKRGEMMSTSENVEVSVSQSCLTLCNPVACSPSRSFLHRISQARILAFLYLDTRALPGIFLTQGSNQGLLHCREILYWMILTWRNLKGKD